MSAQSHSFHEESFPDRAAFCKASLLPGAPVIKKLQPRILDDLVLSEQDLASLRLTLAQDCAFVHYQTNNQALAAYGLCNYTLGSTEVIVELKELTTIEDLNGSYHYESLHLRGREGLISEDTLGDMSRFYVNNESTVYYHLWTSKDTVLIHVAFKGSKDAKGITKIGHRRFSQRLSKKRRDSPGRIFVHCCHFFGRFLPKKVRSNLRHPVSLNLLRLC